MRVPGASKCMMFDLWWANERAKVVEAVGVAHMPQGANGFICRPSAHAQAVAKDHALDSHHGLSRLRIGR